eukprot:SAG31_NODE_37844_length_301_cov_0.712871_1_plen_76_part_01
MTSLGSPIEVESLLDSLRMLLDCIGQSELVHQFVRKAVRCACEGNSVSIRMKAHQMFRVFVQTGLPQDATEIREAV